jgi:hypothetical protein
LEVVIERAYLGDSGVDGMILKQTLGNQITYKHEELVQSKLKGAENVFSLRRVGSEI